MTEPPRERHVLVLGAGAAGTGAALAASAHGARVTVVHAWPGATVLGSGAFDVDRWGAESNEELESGVAETLALLGTIHAPPGGVALVTAAGTVRRARGSDCALFDLGAARRAAGGRRARIAVLRGSRPGWDADGLARAYAEGSGDDFEPFDAMFVRHSDEAVLPDAEFAARHDEPGRTEWLGERLAAIVDRAGSARPLDGIVMPPMLGITRRCAEALTARTGVFCGEAMALPGGPSGLRFEHARTLAFARASIVSSRGRAASVALQHDAVRVFLESGATLEGNALVLATGGLLGGGLQYAPSEASRAGALPSGSRPPVRTSVAGPFRVGAFGRALEEPGSLFGFSPESIARPFDPRGMLERVGVLADPGILAAGDVAAGESRSFFGALASGIRAGRRAAEGLFSGAGAPHEPCP